MSKNFRFTSLLFALMLCFSVAAFGQEQGGSIEGTVKDPNGAVVPGVQVTVTSAGRTQGARQDATTGFVRTVTTDESGFFRVLEMPVGFYSITTAETSGFSAATYNNVEVILGKTTPVNIALTAGGSTNVVDVTTEGGVAIDPTDNKIQTNITTQQAELLPKGTNFTSLLQVAPAVRNEPLAGGFQIDGASGSENTFIIDGQEVTNFRTGTLNGSNNLPFAQVAEIQVKSSGFEAEFGGATGGVINVVTKGGSNEFHGEFGLQFRPSELQAGPRPFRRLFRTGSVANGTFFQTFESIGSPRDNGTDFFPTANFSGPIFRDKLWFFASYSPQFYNTRRDINFVTSDPRTRTGRFSETYTSRQKNEYAFLRLDANPIDKLRLSGQFTYNPIELDGVLPARTLVTGGPAQATFGGQTLVGPNLLGQQGGRINSNNVIGSAVYTPTSNLVFSVRAGRSFLNEKIDAANNRYSYGIPQETRFQCAVLDIPNAAAISGCPSLGFQNVNSNYNILFDVSVRRTLDADATVLVNDFGGRHQFKGGYQFNGIRNNTDQGYVPYGIVVLEYGLPINEISGRSTLPPTGATAANPTGLCAVGQTTGCNLGSGLLQRFGTVGSASSTNNALFIQDKWQPFNRLSLNLGVRFEQEEVPSFQAGAPGIKFNWGDKIAPRIGGAFDLTGDGKTKVFASYGWFYDRFKFELPRGSFGGDFFRVDYFEILPNAPTQFNTFTLSRILGNRSDAPGGNCPVGGITGGTGISRCQEDFRVASNTPGVPIAVGGGVDPDLQAFRQSEFTVGFERDLGFYGLLASGRYTRKQVDRAVEDIGFLNANGSEVYLIGNPGYGVTQTILPSLGFPATPKAVRQYDALELRLDKRFTESFYFNANYTFSRLYGNYPGLASSDETGRNSPNVNRLFDLPFVAFLPGGEENLGRLATDRPHAFKFYGAYSLDWNNLFGFGSGNVTEFGGFTTIQSGTPVSSQFIFEGVNTTLLNGRGDLGRTEAFTQTDFSLRHKYRFGRDDRFTIVADLDVLNLFNQANVIQRSGLLNARTDLAGILGGETVPEAIGRYFRSDARQLINNFLGASPANRDVSYDQPIAFQGPREVRFGFRLLF